MRVMATHALQLRFASRTGILEREQRPGARHAWLNFGGQRRVAQLSIRVGQGRVVSQRNGVIVAQVRAEIAGEAGLQASP